MGEFADNLQKCPQLIIYLGLAFLSVGTSFFFTNNYFVKTETGGMTFLQICLCIYFKYW